jgi:methylmalonyl-CoA mutase
MNFFMEVAKMRAARMLWAKLVKQNSIRKNAKSLSLRTHSQTSGWSLTAQDVFNNVVRTCASRPWRPRRAHQSLHTNAGRSARPADRLLRPHRAQHPALPAAGSRHLRRSDPWGGSYYVERLTA